MICPFVAQYDQSSVNNISQRGRFMRPFGRMRFGHPFRRELEFEPFSPFFFSPFFFNPFMEEEEEFERFPFFDIF